MTDGLILDDADTCADVKVVVVPSFEETTRGIGILLIGFANYFATDVMNCETCAVTQSMRMKAMLSRNEHIRSAQRTDLGFAPK